MVRDSQEGATCTSGRLYVPTVGRSVYVGGLQLDVQLRLDGLRLAALRAVECEEPAATGAAICDQSQITVPGHTQDCVLAFLHEVTRLRQKRKFTHGRQFHGAYLRCRSGR